MRFLTLASHEGHKIGHNKIAHNKVSNDDRDQLIAAIEHALRKGEQGVLSGQAAFERARKNAHTRISDNTRLLNDARLCDHAFPLFTQDKKGPSLMKSCHHGSHKHLSHQDLSTLRPAHNKGKIFKHLLITLCVGSIAGIAIKAFLAKKNDEVPPNMEEIHPQP